MNLRKHTLWKTLLVYFLCIGSIKLMYELRFLPFVGSQVWSIALLLQVYVPVWLYQKEGHSIDALGLHLRFWKRSLAWMGLSSLLILLPSIVGNHLWQLRQKQTLQTSHHPLRQWNPSLQGEPTSNQDSHSIQLYSPQGSNHLILRWKDPLQGFLESDGEIQILSGQRWVQGAVKNNRIEIQGGSDKHALFIRFQVTGKSVHLKLFRDGKPLPVQTIRTGVEKKHVSQPFFERDYYWLFFLLLTQVFLVALPEELFYRGYLLEKLDSVWHRQGFSILGFSISWGNLLVSVLFAITHFLIGHQIYRLAVFFPSLLFGVLKQKNHSLLAPILFHAFCNILMKVLEVWYQ